MTTLIYGAYKTILLHLKCAKAFVLTLPRKEKKVHTLITSWRITDNQSVIQLYFEKKNCPGESGDAADRKRITIHAEVKRKYDINEQHIQAGRS